MAGTEGSETARWSQSHKAGPSSDWSLQLDSMKVESLVIAHQPWRGEYVPGPCTHRPSSHGSDVPPKKIAKASFTPANATIAGRIAMLPIKIAPGKVILVVSVSI